VEIATTDQDEAAAEAVVTQVVDEEVEEAEVVVDMEDDIIHLTSPIEDTQRKNGWPFPLKTSKKYVNFEPNAIVR
jgi:hypothetical protein